MEGPESKKTRRVDPHKLEEEESRFVSRTDPLKKAKIE